MLRRPVLAQPDAKYSYDSLRVDSAIEFGMNEGREHLRDDVHRLSSPDSNVDHKFIVHLYRLSRERDGRKTSERDWSPRSGRILKLDEVARVVRGHGIEIYYAIWDNSDFYNTGAWKITDEAVSRL